MTSTRFILHVDMDAFYASVEQLDAPELRGRPVIVGADPKQGRGRGVVAACSYEARAFGVRSALPIGRAWQLCPRAAFVRPRFERYEEVSDQILSILARFTDLVEPLSIDEAFLDVTGSSRLFGPPEEIARQIKRAVRLESGLVASVGAGPNKFVAKIASDVGKPDGLVLVSPERVTEFLNPLPISRLWGVGPKTAARLRRLGVATIGDIARLPREQARAVLGSERDDLWLLARGIDERPVTPVWEPKSLGAETTFDEDTEDSGKILRTVLALSDRVASRLRRRGFVARGVTLKLRDEAFATVTRAETLREPTDVGEDIYRAAVSLLERLRWQGRRTRLVGVTATRLAATAASEQLSLFPAPRRRRRRLLAVAVDDIRERFGDHAIERAALIKGKEKP